MLTKQPINSVNGVLDYLGDTGDEFYSDLERIATEERDGTKGRDNIRLELDVLRNFLEIGLPFMFDSPHNAIDVGGGHGYLLNSIDQDEKVVCDASLVKLSQAADPVVKIRCNVENLPVETSFFDLAICVDVFEHVKNESDLSKELGRIVKPGGFLFLSVPWKQNLSVLKSKEYLDKYGSYISGHRRSVDEEMIDGCFSDDFEIVSQTSVDIVRRFMEFEPYSIEVFIMRKR